MAAARARSMNLPQTSSASKPLRGFSFFFDANGKDVKILEQKITALGGKVDNFLSNNVNYFIRCNSVGKRQPSPRRSPRLTRGGRDTMSRANKMLERAHAVAKEGGTASLSALQRAKKLGLSVHTVDKLAKWLNEFVEAKTSHNREKSVTSGKREVHDTNVSSNGERKLRGPFMKVSDKKKKYQPLYKELTEAPSVSFDGQTPDSPFERVTRSQNVRAQVPPSRAVTRQGAAASKRGYCELCSATFENKERHMKSAKHRNNITSKNFNTLDKLITDGGSFTDFITNINQVPQNKPQSPPQSPRSGSRASSRGRRVSSAKDLSVREEKALQQSRTDVTRFLRPAAHSSQVSFKVNLQLPTQRKKAPTKRRLFDDDDEDDVVVSGKTTRSQSSSPKRASKRSKTVANGNAVAKVLKVAIGNGVTKATKVVTKVTKSRDGGIVSTRRTRSSRRSVIGGRK